MTYEAQPGTIPHRVIAFLKMHPEGTEFSTAELSEAIGHEGANLNGCCRHVVEAGALQARKREGEGRVVYWSLGDGIPKRKDEPEEPEKPRAPVKPPPAHPLDWKKTKPAKVPKNTDEESHIVVGGFGPPLPPAARPGFRCGVFSDGELHLEKDGSRIVLERFEFESLVSFLERMAEAE